MYPYIGKWKPGSTIFIPWHTFSSDDPSASMTITGLAVTDIEVYRDGNMTQRSSDSGYSLVDTDGIDLDGIVGVQGVSIDTSDNTDAGFWRAGSDYVVVISSITLDTATINLISVRFRLGYEGAFHETSIATLAGQTSFTLTAGPAEDNALNGCKVVVHDIASSVQMAIGYVLDYTGSTRTVTLAADPGIFTMAASDNISFFMPDNVMAINGTAQTANDNGADINTILSRIIGTLATGTHNPQSGDAYAIVNDGTYGNSAIETLVDELETRLTAARAGYLDELGAANIPADIDTLLSRLSAARAGYLDELGAANIPADIDTLLTRIIGTLAAGTHNPQGGDGYAELINGTYGLSAIETLVDELETRLTAVRAGYLDELGPTNLPSDIDSILSRVESFAVGSSGVSVVAESSVVTTGVETLTYTATQEKDGTTNDLADTAGTIERYYQFDVGATGVPSSVTAYGRMFGAGDNIGVYAYNWITTSWKQIGTWDGKALTTLEEVSFPLLTSHVGTGVNDGKVRIRFYATGLTSAELFIDYISVSFAVVQSATGYENGAIWIDTVGGTAGTVKDVNGVADNPVDSLADALTLSSATGLKKFKIVSGSSITLLGATEGYVLEGENWNLALNGQSIAGSHFHGANVSGISSGATAPSFSECFFATVTIPPCTALQCGFGASSGTFTGASAGQYIFSYCFSVVPGSGSPAFVFSGLGPSTGINNRAWTGGSTWTLDSDCTISHEVLAGGGQTFTTGGADVELRGTFRSATYTLSGAGTVQQVGITGPITISGTATTVVNLYGVSSTLIDTSVNTTVTDRTTSVDNVWDEELTASSHNIANSAGRRVRDQGSNVILTGTSPNTGGTANTAIRIELDGDASSVDGAYDPCTVVFTGGTGAGQSRTGFEYDGVNKLLYVKRDFKVVPDDTTEYSILGFSGDGHINEGVIRGGGSNTAILNSLASDIPNAYVGQLLHLVSGIGQDQIQPIIAYNEVTKEVTLEDNWDIQPVNGGTVYAILPAHVHTLTAIATAVWSAATRTLTSFGTLIADIWSNVSRTLSGTISDLDALDTSLKVEHDASQVQLSNIQSRLPAALVSGKMDSDARAINGNLLAAVRLALSAGTIVIGTAQAGTLSTTQMSTNLTEVTPDHYKSRAIIWTTGNLTDQYSEVTAYSATGVLTFTAVTEAPSAGDTFILV